MLNLDWRKMLIEALPAMSATAAGLYAYRKRGSLPLAALGAIGGYGLFLAGRRVVRWVLDGVPALPTKTAELPKTPVAVPESMPAPAPVQPAAPAPGTATMSGLATWPDGKTTTAHVSVLDDAEDGMPRGGQILPFAQGGKK